MKRPPLLALLAASLVAAAPASAESGAVDDRPVVVELFTSQSCYSCPPAEAYLGELAERPDVIALEFHVDYWDDLVYGQAGAWKDPYSSPQATARQRAYARHFRSRRVYTPQMVIDGRWQEVGSQRRAVSAAISRAQSRERPGISVTATRAADGRLEIAATGTDDAPAAIWLVRFERANRTEVRAGENKGKTLANHHVVTDLQRLGDWRGEPAGLTVADPRQGDSQDCAILVQSADLGPILGAARCPS